MSQTKTLRYTRPRGRPKKVDPLLSKLRNLAAAAKDTPLTLRSLRTQYDIAPITVYALANRFPSELRLEGDGRSHRVVLRRPGEAPFAAAVETAPPPAPGPSVAVDLPPAETPALPVIDHVKTTPAYVLDDPAYDALLQELRGTHRLSNRYGGKPGSRRERRPLLDINTGRNLEVQTAMEKLEPDKPIGRRYDYDRLRVLLEQRAATETAGAVIAPARHREYKNGGGQRPGDGAVRRIKSEPDLVLKHTLSKNRGVTTKQIDSINPHPHPGLPTG